MNKEELTKVLIAASDKIDSNTRTGKANDLVHYWLSEVLSYGVENTIIKWAKDIQTRGDIIKDGD